MIFKFLEHQSKLAMNQLDFYKSAVYQKTQTGS